MSIAIVRPHGSMRGVADEASSIPAGIKSGCYMLAVKVRELERDKSPSSVNLILIILTNETLGAPSVAKLCYRY